MGAERPRYPPTMANIRLGSVSLDCADPVALGAFWAELLGGEVAFSSEEFVAVKTDRSG
jgi:hypothetical protein